MSTLGKLLKKQSAEALAKIETRAEEIRREITLAKIREELNRSQTELAQSLGISQPSIAKLENVDNDPKLSTLKRYIKALGGELSIDVTLPNGKRIGLHL
ncbi:helix-turn-helix domain-containing protein [Proteus mirabilis]|uniref:helix-turn-helix domain-containing protein n=1 Tax=Proteus mirabilis TaxID=584 RepID=UPI00036D5251|nr:helix-turn-helix domain-containing protein [Proteus mirabilis]ECG2670333.1 helix-turn-helix domain-containing protein [Salmonella enterica subsp. enterica serovar Takoradi]EHF3470194.1 helix-turn-helix domain-containing protein [Proteus mirabilis]ELZ9706262.1 helix-turn-helix domain-containing protein [Proteus mirabilis]KAB7725147.1 helix-turn-helix domain-containing protein [Proteus mirabilis]MBG2907662.1 helix-turn-helix domain-containing protein [Proteus mirabilis]